MTQKIIISGSVIWDNETIKVHSDGEVIEKGRKKSLVCIYNLKGSRNVWIYVQNKIIYEDKN
jgi:hypothetical protein